MATINDTTFATHYLSATEWLLDGMSHPSAERFNEARIQAGYAKRQAGTEAEISMASRLLGTVMDSARAMGYTGYGHAL